MPVYSSVQAHTLGSDFTNDDLMKASSLSRDYKHKILRTEVISKQNLYVIECLPKPLAPVVWGKIIYWAREKDSLPVKLEYYDDQKKLIRTVSYAQFKKMDGTLTMSSHHSPQSHLATLVRRPPLLLQLAQAQSVSIPIYQPM